MNRIPEEIVKLVESGEVKVKTTKLQEVSECQFPVKKRRKDKMSTEIKTISLSLPYKLGSVNCYLIETDTGYILIDTGCSNKRTELEKELERAGCKPGNLKLVLLTHGDFDHTGNAAYLRKKFGTKIVMHHDDSGMVERGDMFWNRRKGNILLGMIARILFRFGKKERFKPDLYIDEGYDLSEYGFDAKVLHIPGHSKGSIGILTADGNLFCGDLFENKDNPALSSIMDDLTAANASVEKLKSLKINTVYPGHGKPFSMERFIVNHRKNNKEETNMSALVLVAYATRYGSTQEVAEAVAATLRECGLEVDIQPMQKVRTLAGYRALVLGAPLYIGRWHKDAQRFLSLHQEALTQRPVAVFMLGPTQPDEKEWEGVHAQLDQELAKYPWLTPVALEVFGGKFDPAKLRFSDRLIASLPASPLHNAPASDLRDWTAIRAWASNLAAMLQPALPQ